MSGTVTLERHGSIAVVTIDNPPVNAASQAVRAGLMAAIETITADPTIAGAILTCTGKTFVAGADIAEFGRPPVAPRLGVCVAALEACTKPVLALLHGTALGGGCELALGCHWRVIDASGSLGLPEVTLGLVPGAGGTQRLPRLVGLATALDLVTSGRRVAADEALRLGFVDAIVAPAIDASDRLAFALGFLRDRLGAPLRRLAAVPFPDLDPAAIAAARATATKRQPGRIAPQRAIALLEASAGLDFPAGLALEAATFADLVQSPQAEALRHMFFAERAIGRPPRAATPRPLAVIGVVGGGTMGAGIVAACLLGGFAVRLVERDAVALAAGVGRVEAILADARERGKVTAERHATLRADGSLFAPSLDLASLAAADLVIEAVFESMPVKRELFAALDAIAKPGAVLATNTSYLAVAEIAAATRRPGDVIGLHFFAPAQVMKLLEVVAPAAASAEAVATGFALAKALGKLGVWTRDREGFIGNRILSTYRRAADHMVEDGASPFAIDAAQRAFGMAMGLYEMQDLAGLDIGWATRKRLAPTRDPAERYVHVSDRLCERGLFGRKTGRGYYLYGEGGGRPTPNPLVEEIIAEERRAKAIVPSEFPAEEIERRIVLAMIAEGARILGEGVALRPGDIDVVMVAGYGFPRWRGGPMHLAERRGLAKVLAEVEALREEDPLWLPAETLVTAAKNGRWS